MGSDLKAERRAERTATSLVVESARVADVMEKLHSNGELLSQMATMLHDGAIEYERVVSYLRRIRKARTTYQARHLAEQCLREI
jgi:hypothetical protein